MAKFDRPRRIAFANVTYFELWWYTVGFVAGLISGAFQ